MIIKYNPVDRDGVERHGAKYLPRDIFAKCFKKGKLLHVDKTIAGSGMSHSFLTTTPAGGTINILIAPNRQVVLSKEESYLKNRPSFNNEIQFFCTGSQDSILHRKTEIVVTTTDTCLKMFDDLSNREIGLVLVDEYHSTIQGSLYRKSLKGFLNKIVSAWLNKDTCITTVSATPLLFAKTDIVLIPTSYYRQYDIILNDNYEDVIEEAKNYLHNTDENVIVFTNSISVISQFSEETSDNKRVLRADLKVGSRLLESICKRYQIIEDSKLTIGSSQAFEGFDIEESNIRVYFFQDLSQETEDGFNAGNIYQAINRTRNGYNSATYTKTPKMEVLSSIEQIVNKVKRSKVPNHSWGSRSKLSSVRALTYEDIFRFIPLLDVHNTAEGSSYTVNKELLNLEREKEVMINKGLHAPEYAQYLENRNINLIDVNSIPKTVKLINTRNQEYYCYINREHIVFNKLNEKPFNFIPSADSYKPSYTLDRLIRSFTSQYRTHLCYVNYMQYEDENRIFATDKQMRILSHALSGDLRHFLEGLMQKYTHSKQKELRALRNSPTKLSDLKKKIKYTQDNLYRNILKLIGILSNEEIMFPENLVGNRDYNLLTKLPMEVILEVGLFLNISVIEYDIKACNPRILYATVGLQLPEDFYGENKVNKGKINTILNMINRESNNGKYSEAQHKAHLKYSMKRLGVNERVVDYLIYKFYNKDKSSVFNLCSWHEANICEIANWRFFGGAGVRRHDSLILFDTLFTEYQLSDFEYLGVRGWFKNKPKAIIEEVDFNNNNTQFKIWN